MYYVYIQMHRYTHRGLDFDYGEAPAIATLDLQAVGNQAVDCHLRSTVSEKVAGCAEGESGGRAGDAKASIYIYIYVYVYIYTGYIRGL